MAAKDRNQMGTPQTMRVGFRVVDRTEVRCTESGGYREAAARGPTAAVTSQATDGGNDELEQ
jgi:hypothetical protein